MDDHCAEHRDIDAGQGPGGDEGGPGPRGAASGLLGRRRRHAFLEIVLPRELREADDLADGVPGARYVEIRRTSHGVPITHAEEVNRLLREHLTRG